ncbi:MAG: complex I subunit 5 family protein [Clostridium sp.]
MSFVQNVPCFSILAAMFAAIITSAVKGKAARWISIGISAAIGVATAFLLAFLMGTGESYVYVMGHFPAPWGNELRFGMLEAAMALLFCVIMLLALWGGMEEARGDLEEEKANFYYIMADLMLASNLALVYTNDLFTAYVFVEISTIAACGLILGKFNDLTIAAGVRYMIMSLMGSGLLLLGISFFYDMTGHLLMSNMKESILFLWQTGEYRVPLILTIGLVSVGLAIKSALWPFHSWLPNAYGHATVSSSAMLSSIVSKGYIFLLLKIIYRVTGADIFAGSHVIDILLVFGIIGMILGSLDAVRQKNLRKMIAYSSVAQIGYIFMGMGLGTAAGTGAGIYHIFAHAAAKSLVFVAAFGLIKASAGNPDISGLRGAGFRNKVAGVGFVAGSLSMVGIPGFAGFVSKLMFAEASLEDAAYAIPVLAALAISTVLNAIYFMRVVLILYTPLSEEEKAAGQKEQTMGNPWQFKAAIAGGVALNLFLGICTAPVMGVVQKGLEIFG